MTAEKAIPNFWNKGLPPGVGHWTEQEAPTEVNRLMHKATREIVPAGPFVTGILRAAGSGSFKPVR